MAHERSGKRPGKRDRVEADEQAYTELLEIFLAIEQRMAQSPRTKTSPKRAA